ncbi:MAG: alcohol dehydrogenase, partial [Rhodospirillaceae bacterium]|nr:alcohol dehydrogenase [Rhodospirillaceae bacterium]
MTVEPAALRGTWSFPTTIWFGAGKVTMLARACKTLGMTRPLFVTDPGLAGLEMVASALAQA